ncbi:uncharacterized protein LOC114828093 [Galendromus occidentalis]|uniref:Uncharacterized protein LOC114828093 n=1 Tax=Galendromus occidentalis TaxID=34638 RepID=A0AAJ7SDJ4_9ACAR|nr:uncharacterized protein LOC114828093 [Galendromus occidentalis]
MASRDKQRAQEDSASSHGYSDLGDDQPGPSALSLGDTKPQKGDDGTGDIGELQIATRARSRDIVILRLDGSNYTEWRVLIAPALDADPYALDVAMGDLIPPTPGSKDKASVIQQRKYDAGNRAARCTLFASLQPALAVSMFPGNSATVAASEMWRDITGWFTATNGGLKRLAMSKLTSYAYQPNKTAGENLFRFNQIISRLAGLGMDIPNDLKITFLLDALPSNWESFEQGFTSRDESSKSYFHLQAGIEILDGGPYCWEVVSGALGPPDATKAKTAEGKNQQKNFIIGNKAGRYILFNSIHPNLATELFSENSDTVEASEIWRLIKGKFTSTNGVFKEDAMSDLTNFTYLQSQSTLENLLRFKTIIARLTSYGVKLGEDYQCARLLSSLPGSWEQLKQGWTVRPENQQTLSQLIKSIEIQAKRQVRESGHVQRDCRVSIGASQQFNARGRGRPHGRGRQARRFEDNQVHWFWFRAHDRQPKRHGLCTTPYRAKPLDEDCGVQVTQEAIIIENDPEQISARRTNGVFIIHADSPTAQGCTASAKNSNPHYLLFVTGASPETTAADLLAHCERFSDQVISVSKFKQRNLLTLSTPRRTGLLTSASSLSRV